MKPEIDEKDQQIIDVIAEREKGIRFYEIHNELIKNGTPVPMATLRSRILRLERIHKLDVYRELNVVKCYLPGKMPHKVTAI